MRWSELLMAAARGLWSHWPAPFESLFGRYRRPATVGIELVQRRGYGRGLLAQVLLPHHAILIHDERHDAACAIHRGIGDQRESAGLLAVDDVLASAAAGRRS